MIHRDGSDRTSFSTAPEDSSDDASIENDNPRQHHQSISASAPVVSDDASIENDNPRQHHQSIRASAPVVDVEPFLGTLQPSQSGGASPARSASERRVPIVSQTSFNRSTSDHLFRSPSRRIVEWLQVLDHDRPDDAQRDRALMYLLLENSSFGYPGTDGTFLSNYVAYCLNRHPLISIVTAHPLHPFTRPERLVVLVCSFCWAFAVKAIMHREPLSDQPWYIFYSVVALLVLPYELFIRVLTVCACMQYDETPRGHARRRRCHCYGRMLLATLTLINITFVAYGIWFTVHVHRVRPYSLLRQSWSTILAKLWALLLWFPIWLPIFVLWYNAHKRGWIQAHPPGHPEHVCATSSEDEGVSVFYWMIVSHRFSPPSEPRSSKRFTPGLIPMLPFIDTSTRTVTIPAFARTPSAPSKGKDKSWHELS